MSRVIFRVDIICLSHSKPAIVGRRYYVSMADVLTVFENFTPRNECPWHSNESLIPRFAGPSSYEATIVVEDTHVNTLRII